MKLGILAGAALSVAFVASSAAAQVCQGDLSFRSSPKHVGGALGLSDNTTAFGANMTFGHPQGLFGGGSLGMLDYQQLNGNSLVLGGGVGYAMPLQVHSAWQLCPAGTLSLGFGPSIAVGGGNSARLSTQVFSLGASIGRALPLNKTVTLLPFGSAAIGHSNVHLAGAGSNGDSYLQLGFGAGFQLSPSFVIRPSMTLLAGADAGTDDTIFSLNVSFALPR